MSVDLKMLRDLMVDLETWGTGPGCIIRSIGAVAFDRYSGQLGDEFYAVVTEKSCKKLKLFREPGTEAWWNKPEQEHANRQLVEAVDQLDIKEALTRFTSFFRNARTQFVWSQGNNFDEPIISYTYRKLEMEPPWKFWDSRDTRTAYDMAEFNPRTIRRMGTYHNALDDAKHQVECVYRAHAKNKGKIL
jgi:hypothetical protein